MSPLLLVARQELLLAARARSTQIFAGVFAVLALGVASSGYVLTGGVGVQDFARTAASLVQLVLLVVPLMALLLGVVALSGERGSLELLFAQPLARRDILLGKLLGLLAALAGAEAIGFGAAGVLIYWKTDEVGLSSYLLLVAGAGVLTAIFLGIAGAIASGTPGRRRTRALALALVVWFCAVVFLDLLALGLCTLLPSGTASRLLILSVLVNPASALRTAELLLLEGTAAFGAASLALLRFTHGALGAGLALGGSLLVWLVAPVLVAMRRLRAADL
ncbi:MAG TPA: ABC transporter permease subunit [Gemmatimonadales bacterium]|nr:ABC transporter permease subunit [Gemmatimonadales bacterium]